MEVSFKSNSSGNTVEISNQFRFYDDYDQLGQFKPLIEKVVNDGTVSAFRKIIHEIAELWDNMGAKKYIYGLFTDVLPDVTSDKDETLTNIAKTRINHKYSSLLKVLPGSLEYIKDSKTVGRAWTDLKIKSTITSYKDCLSGGDKEGTEDCSSELITFDSIDVRLYDKQDSLMTLALYDFIVENDVIFCSDQTIECFFKPQFVNGVFDSEMTKQMMEAQGINTSDDVTEVLEKLKNDEKLYKVVKSGLNSQIQLIVEKDLPFIRADDAQKEQKLKQVKLINQLLRNKIEDEANRSMIRTVIAEGCKVYLSASDLLVRKL